jgi:DNA-directed RNA polymerase specialized sigma24 family protein
MTSVNERELLSAARQGSQIAYRELIQLHQGAVYRFAWALIGEEHAQSVTENAFLTAWRQLEFSRTLPVSFRERLLQLVCLDGETLSKRERRHRVHLPSTMDEASLNFPCPPLRYDPRTNMEHLALQTDTEEALRALPFRFRQILLLHEMGDLAPTQIADLTGSDAQTVLVDLRRARLFLRRQIILSGGFFPPDENEATGEKSQACPEQLSALADAADGLCTNAEKQILANHMATCPGCRSYYASLDAIHYSLSVMKRDVPGDMADYIINRIRREAGQDEGTGEEAPKRRHFRPAFGRFTIIALCIALVLLAYAGKMEKQVEQMQEPSTGQIQAGNDNTNVIAPDPNETISPAAPADVTADETEPATPDTSEDTPEETPDDETTAPEETPAEEEAEPTTPEQGEIHPGGTEGATESAEDELPTAEGEADGTAGE